MVEIQRQALRRLIEFFKTDAVTAGLIGHDAAIFVIGYTAHLAWVSSATFLSFSMKRLPTTLRSPFNWITPARTNRKIRAGTKTALSRVQVANLRDSNNSNLQIRYGRVTRQ